MKKRLICLALAVMMLALAACSTKPAAPTQEPAASTPVPTAPAETEKPLTADDITIERQDLSMYDNDGSALIEIGYDLVRLPESSRAYSEINEELYDDFEDFKDSIHEDEFAQYKDIAKSYKSSSGAGEWQPYLDTYAAEITTLADGYLSVKYTTDWYMGGVSNTNHYGLTFDLNTGDEIDLDDIQQALPQSSNLLGFIHSMVYNYMETEGLMDRMFDNAVENTELDDYHFYLNNKEIVICTDTYLLADGAAGSFEIPLGIYIDNLSNTQLNA